MFSSLTWMIPPGYQILFGGIIYALGIAAGTYVCYEFQEVAVDWIESGVKAIAATQVAEHERWEHPKFTEIQIVKVAHNDKQKEEVKDECYEECKCPAYDRCKVLGCSNPIPPGPYKEEPFFKIRDRAEPKITLECPLEEKKKQE